jgi:hypothetical protein
MKSKIQETSRVLKTLESQFRLLLPTSFQSSRLAVDMADIHEICRCYLSCINDLMKSDVANRRHIEDVFYKIDCDLFEHLPYHVKSLNKMMPQIKRAIQRPSKGKQLLLGSKARRRKNVSRPPARRL